jgi:xylulokinase
LLGIDVGTSGTKTLVCDETGRVLGAASMPHPISSPRPLWSEQNPEDWWRATVESVRAAIEETGIDGQQVVGVGLSGQMHGLVCLDENQTVLRPAILWNDQRTAAECAEITRAVGYEKLIEIACNPALTGFTAPKILWVRHNEPEVFEKTRHMVLPKDYVRFRLSGTFATEVSDASGTLLLDIRARQWSPELLQTLQIDASCLPPCYESTEVTAQVTRQVADILGIPEGTPIVGGGGDQAAGAVGNGIVRHGAISATLGTSGVVFAFADEVVTDPEGRVHTFCHAVPGKWHVMGVMLSAGGSLQWFRDSLGEIEIEQAQRLGIDPYDILCEEAEAAAPGCEGLLFLPYLTGERTPHADPNARGAWIGLTPRHGRNELVRAVMEGITYGMKDSLEIIRHMGIEIAEIRISGGGARNALWRQMQADIYEHEVSLVNSEEGAAYGAALLASVGAGCFQSVEEACESAINVADTVAPDPDAGRAYRAWYPVFRKLYGVLKDEFAEITRITFESD